MIHFYLINLFLIVFKRGLFSAKNIFGAWFIILFLFIFILLLKRSSEPVDWMSLQSDHN